MSELLFYFLPGIIFIGLASCYSDFRYRKISNRLVIVSILYSLIIYSFIFLLTTITLNQYYLITYLVNIIFSLIVGFLFFKYAIWAPGDGKLLLNYSILVPLDAYLNPRIPYIPTTMLVSNTLVITGLVLFTIFFIDLRKNIPMIMGNILNRNMLYDFSKYFLAIISISWVIKKIIISNLLYSDPFLIYLISMMIYGLLYKILDEKKVICILFSIIIIKLIFDFEHIFSITSLLGIAKYAVVFVILKRLIFDAYQNINTVELPPNKLKPYMVLSEDYKHPVDNNVLDVKDKHLTETNINDLKQWEKEFPSYNWKVPVKKNTVFAIYMFISVLITISVKGEIINWIFKLFN